jgi:hypothetical protein
VGAVTAAPVRRVAHGGRRRGAALPFVLLALVVGLVGASAAASVAREARRAARGATAGVQAELAADGALAALVARWPARWNLALGAGDGATREVDTPAGRARVRAVRLDAERFALEAESRAAGGALPGDGPAVRRRMLVVRLRHTRPDVAAAVTAAGEVRLTAGAAVVAEHAAPDGWTECPPQGTAAADAVAAPDVVADLLATVDGAVRTDSAAWAAAVLPRFGDAAFAEHAGRAHVLVDAAGALSPTPAAGGDGTGGEPCPLGAANWGEPARGAGAVAACEGALPVVHVRAPLVRLRGPARFQGTLLVDGDLAVEGEVRAAGLVVVRGAVDASAGALVLDGALVAGGAVRLGAGSRVRGSTCAVDRASLYGARATPLARRAWSEVVR